MDSAAEILEVFERGSANSVFPLLDHPYYFLAASRLSLYRSAQDWALVFDTFAFSPRAGLPTITVVTFAGRLHARNPRNYYTEQERRNWFAQHPHDEFEAFYPLSDGWRGELERVAKSARSLELRGRQVSIPAIDEYGKHGIKLVEPPHVKVFELCRYLAAVYREDVLATEPERRVNVPPELEPLLRLDEWHHPDRLRNETPAGSVTFQQLAAVLASGDESKYRPTSPPNNHWRFWPIGGSL
jgi:hypothetical protein